MEAVGLASNFEVYPRQTYCPDELTFQVNEAMNKNEVI
jgi:hypothetical protein